jgi:DNA-binding NarL/FixJ family response regulator
MPPSTLLHIEDDPLWGVLIGEMVRGWPEVQYLALAVTGPDGIAQSTRLQPDLVLLDLQLPGAGGFDIAAALAGLPKPPRIIMLTMLTNDAVLYHATRPPIAGLLWKGDSINAELRRAIAESVAGRKCYSARIQAGLQALRGDPNAFFKILSDREIDLLPWLGRGESDDRIAGRTGLQSTTVRSHRQHIMHKLRLSSTPELMCWIEAKGFALRPLAGRS